MGRPIRTYVFENGMVMTFDEKGKQVPGYQGPADEILPLLERDFPETIVEKGVSWEEVRRRL